MVVALTAVAAIAGGALFLTGRDGGQPAAAPVPPTTTTAAPAPTPLQDGVAALKSGMAAQMVEMIDNGVFTDDVTALTAYQEPGDFVWGRGLAPRHHGVVNAAIGEGGQLVCLTTNTDEVVVVATLLIVRAWQRVADRAGPSALAPPPASSSCP